MRDVRDPAPRPRVLATGSDFERTDRLRRGDGPAADWFDALRARGTALLDAPPERHRLPDGVRLLPVSRAVVDRSLDLATLYRLTGEARWADRLGAEVEAVCAFPDWNPAHFLDTAEMAAAVGVAYDWCHDHWSEAERERMADALADHAFEVAVSGYRGEDSSESHGGGRPATWWIEAEHNWNTVCNGGLTVGALAVAGDGHAPDLVAAVVEGARESVERAVENVGPAGGWEEGVGYWRYNAEYLAAYLATVENALETDFGYADREGVTRIGDFPVQLTGPAGTFTFGDVSAERTIEEPAFHWFARRFDRPEWTGYQREAAGESGAALDLVWFDPECDRDFRSLDRQCHFPGAEDAVVMRSGWGEADAFCGVKGGDNQVNHGDLDLGSFVFDRDGVRWATDLGANDYNIPGYWETGAEGRRWTYYRKRAEGHNVPVLDPDEGPDQDPFAEAEVLAFDPEGPSVRYDLTPAYPSADRVERGVALDRGRGELLVRDEIEGAGEGWWFLHTEAEIGIETGDAGTTATLTRQGETLAVRALTPDGAAFEARDAAPLPTSPAPEAEEPVEGVRKLALRLPERESVAVTVRLGSDAPAREGELRGLADW
jgi:hypothetical protein